MGLRDDNRECAVAEILEVGQLLGCRWGDVDSVSPINLGSNLGQFLD